MEPSDAEPRAPRGRLQVDPWVRFAGVFAVLGIGSEFLYFLVIRGSDGLAVYLAVVATLSGILLNLLGQNVEVVETSIWNVEFMVDIAPECDAIQLCALLCSAIIAFPAPLRVRLAGLGWGLLGIQGCNFVRIVSLYFIGSFARSKTFHAAHEVWWPIALIIYTVVLWLLWARQAEPPVVAGPSAPRPAGDGRSGNDATAATIAVDADASSVDRATREP